LSRLFRGAVNGRGELRIQLGYMLELNIRTTRTSGPNFYSYSAPISRAHHTSLSVSTRSVCILEQQQLVASEAANLIRTAPRAPLTFYLRLIFLLWYCCLVADKPRFTPSDFPEMNAISNSPDYICQAYIHIVPNRFTFTSIRLARFSITAWLVYIMLTAPTFNVCS